MKEEFDFDKEFEDYQEYLVVSEKRLKLMIEFDNDNSELDDLLKELNDKEIFK